jgi:hypothetical protein
MPNFPLTVLKVILILFQKFPKTLATLATLQSLTNNKNFNYNGSSRLTGRTHFNYNSNYKSTSFSLTLTMAENQNQNQNQYTPIQQTEAEITFHDTIQRRSRPSSPSTSVTSQIEPTNLLPTTAAMTSITIGGVTIEVKSTEQVRTTTGALYTKQIRATYDNDKKGKLDLLKLIQSKQQQPYVATSISVNDPEKLLNHYSLSKLNKECSRNLNKYDLLPTFTNIIFPVAPGSVQLQTDPSGACLTHDLFSNTFQVTAQQVADSSRWYSGYTAPSARYQEDLEWSLAYFENNVDSSLYARIHAKLLTYDDRCRGGPLFFKLLNDETTTNSDANKKALITIVDTYKIRVSCKGERIPDVVDLFRSITDTVLALHDDSLPDEYVDKLIVIFTTTSVPDFNDLFDALKKQLFAAQLQASISDSLIVPVNGSSLLTNNIKGAYYVLNYAGKAYYTLCQRGAWDKCLQQVPGESAHINPSNGNPSSDGSHFEIKCFNCGGPHHLRLCPKPRDQAAVDRNRTSHNSSFPSKQPTGFRGNNQRPWSRPTKWRLPEEGENNKRIIDNKPYTFNPTSKRWEPDSTPDSGQQQLPTAANVAPPVPPTTPSAPTLPPSPFPSDMKGAFFSGGYATPDMSVAKQKEMMALQMIHMKQVFENM